MFFKWNQGPSVLGLPRTLIKCTFSGFFLRSSGAFENKFLIIFYVIVIHMKAWGRKYWALLCISILTHVFIFSSKPVATCLLGLLYLQDWLHFVSAYWASQGTLEVKNLPANARDIKNASSIPGSGRFPGGGNGNPLQYSCLENLMDRGTWRATKIAESDTTEAMEHASAYWFLHPFWAI